MRKSLCLVLTLLLVPGCLDEPGEDEQSSDDSAPDLPGNATAPAPLHWGEDILVGADPFNAASVATPIAPCSQDVSSCEFYDFTINGTNGTFDLTASLSWGLQANDLDLYLYQGNTEVSQDGINPIGGVPGAPQQTMHATVSPGTYTFWVVVWNGAADSYTLDVEFA